ncbi:2659_t:CDS:2, partial [Gigaspora rosea]
HLFHKDINNIQTNDQLNHKHQYPTLGLNQTLHTADLTWPTRKKSILTNIIMLVVAVLYGSKLSLCLNDKTIAHEVEHIIAIPYYTLSINGRNTLQPYKMVLKIILLQKRLSIQILINEQPTPLDIPLPTLIDVLTENIIPDKFVPKLHNFTFPHNLRRLIRHLQNTWVIAD